MLDRIAMCGLLDVGTATLTRMNSAGKLPSPRQVGRQLRWVREEVLAWLKRPKADGKLQDRQEWALTWAALVKAGKN